MMDDLELTGMRLEQALELEGPLPGQALDFGEPEAGPLEAPTDVLK
jgi:hypothetical protein